MQIFIHSIPAWLEQISLACVVGVLVCRLWVLSTDRSNFTGRERLYTRLWFLFGTGAVIALACSVVDLLMGTAEMSGRPVLSVLPLVSAVIKKTHFGHIWLIRMIVLGLALVAVTTARRIRDTPVFLSFLLILSAVIAATESASGHAADAGDLKIPEIMDWLHLIGSQVWGGGLFVLSVIVLPALMNRSEETAETITDSARRFSKLAGISVTLIFLTALYNARASVGSVEALVESPYGRAVAAKGVLFLFLLCLAAYNRFVMVPSLEERAGREIKRSGMQKLIGALFPRTLKSSAALRFRQIVRVEAIAMICLLFCVALLRHEVPARHFLHLAHSGHAAGHGQEEHMHYAPHPESVVMRLDTGAAPPVAGTPVSMTVHLEDRKGRPLQGLVAHHERVLHAVIIGSDLKVFAHIHPEDLGMLTDTMLDAAAFPLRYTFPKAGTYLVGIDFATEDGIYSKTTMLTVGGSPAMTVPRSDLSRLKSFGLYEVSLGVPGAIKAGKETTLTYTIEKNGKPVADLQPYLGAPMHLAVASADLKHFIHTHGSLPGGSEGHENHAHAMLPERFGPTIEVSVVFPSRGVYAIFSQTEHKGNVLLFPFMVDVE